MASSAAVGLTRNGGGIGLNITTRAIQRGLGAGLLAAALAVMWLPFWVMIVTSFQDTAHVLAGQTHPLWAWPLSGANYQQLFNQLPMVRYLANSSLVAMATTVGHVIVASMAGYAFARLRFAGREALFFAVLLTLMIPPQVNLVPLFLLMKQLGWVDTYWALIVPGWFGGFGVFLFRQWFTGFPPELEEAARLDGCSPWQVFTLIALPLAVPVVVTLALFVFIATWNSFTWPLVVTFSDEVRTLPLGLAALKDSFREAINWPLLMSAATTATLPVAGLFLLGQRAFLDGILAGGVKE
jgi:multiple sugar transport system permease protein